MNDDDFKKGLEALLEADRQMKRATKTLHYAVFCCAFAVVLLLFHIVLLWRHR